jgi:hypothetical protein
VNVNVNVQPVAFNFGVNQGGVSGFGPISSDGCMGGSSMLGWGMADEMNQQGLETLLGQNLDPTTAPGGIVYWCSEDVCGARGVAGKRLGFLRCFLRPARRAIPEPWLAELQWNEHTIRCSFCELIGKPDLQEWLS